MACSSRLRSRARRLWRRATKRLTSIRMGRRFCAIKEGGTSLNLRIGWLYHQWMSMDCEEKNLSDNS